MKNKLEDLRDHLFETIESLKDKDNPMDLKRAAAIKDVAQTLINSGKLELEYIDITGEKASAFLPSSDRQRLPSPSVPRLVNG